MNESSVIQLIGTIVGSLLAGGVLVTFGYFVGRKGAWDAMKENSNTWRESAQLAKEEKDQLTERLTRLEALYDKSEGERIREIKLRELLELENRYFDMVLHILAKHNDKLPTDVSEEIKIVLKQKDEARKEARGAFLDYELSLVTTNRSSQRRIP